MPEIVRVSEESYEHFCVQDPNACPSYLLAKRNNGELHAYLELVKKAQEIQSPEKKDLSILTR